MDKKKHHGAGLVDRVVGKAEELAGTVIMHDDLRIDGEIREERGEIEAELEKQERS